MNRIQQFQERFFTSETDAVLITDDIHRRYLLGFPSSAGILVVLPGAAYLIIDFRYIEAAKQVVHHCEVVLQDRPFEQLQEIFKRHGAHRIAVEEEHMTLSAFAHYQKQFPDLELLSDAGVCAVLKAMRQIKSPEEIRNLRDAQQIAEHAFHEILGFIREGVTERQIAAELEYRMKCAGSDDKSFDTICVAGANSSLPHGVPGNYAVQKGDFVTMDFGAVINGYHSDMTRTIAVGTVSDKQKHVYDTVLEAQNRAIQAIRAGACAVDVDAAARQYIEQAQGYAGCFGHGLGHGVGLEIHEAPSLSFRSQEVLEENMLVTIEPGIYLAGQFGVRIEDFAVVRADGAEIVTNCPKELICL